MKRIAIIGSGISGLVLAQQLAGKAEIVVFEKAQGVGGRMSTRYANSFCFDHGTQYFTARTKEFQDFLQPYLKEKVVAQWQGPVINLEVGKEETKHSWLEPHFVASPNMNSLCKVLSEGVDVRKSCEIAPLSEKVDSGWNCFDQNNLFLGHFDWVISTAPPLQTIKLFDRHMISSHPLRFTSMQGCYALMLGFDTAWDRPWIAAKVYDNPIQWISVNSSKPWRDCKKTCLVAHSTNNWAQAHLECDLTWTQIFLKEQFELLTAIDVKNASYISLHRWRYAMVDKPKIKGSYLDRKLRLAATSDWYETSGIEAVWFHAKKLASMIADELG